MLRSYYANENKSAPISNIDLLPLGIGKIEKFVDAMAKNDKKTVEDLLLEPEIKPFIREKKLFLTQIPALVYAAWLDRSEIVDCLLQAGSLVNSYDRSFCTALHCAAHRGNAKLVARLLDAGADIHWVNEDGNTALHTAVYACNRDVVKILLEKGANVTVQNRYGKTPENLARKDPKPDHEIIDMLHQRLDPKERFKSAINNNDTDTVQKLLTLPEIKPYLREKNLFPLTQCSALTYAVLKRHPNIVRCLLAHKPALNNSNTHGDTALHLAAFNGDVEIVRCLLLAGASMNMRDKHGNTPLHIAAEKGYKEIVDMLLDAKASISITNHEDQIPRDLAMLHPQLSQDQHIINSLKPFSLIYMLTSACK